LIGTNEGGLNRFNPSKGTFKSFNFTKGIGKNTVLAIYENKKGNFWVGTFRSGIHLFDRDKGVSVYSITKKDGLANNQIMSILEDDSGNLWIATYIGLSKFSQQTHSVTNLHFPDVDQNMFYNSALKTSSGEMLFGTFDGFIMIHPDSIKDDPVPPQVVISNVSLFNKPEEKLEYEGFISELKELNLSYNENDLRFDYIGLHFGEPEKNQYKYLLENFDDDWIDAGSQRNATYTNLNAGEYVFRVTACNRDGIWNEEGASLKIIIPPPFWASWWAYSLYVMFAFGLLYGVRRYELNRTHLKNQVKLDEVKLKEREETDKMKSRFFANISHEFRTPLTLILGPTEKILSKSADDETQKQLSLVKRSANRLLGLINQLLDLSKLEEGKLELRTSKSNIVPFIKGLTMSFESIAERKDITLKVKNSSDEIEMYFDKEKMTKIMTNLLSNAFKFTPRDGQITVSLTETNTNTVDIKIRDSGIGISEEELSKLFDRFYQVDSSFTREQEGTGIGLALTKELVELHRGIISVDSKLGSWTEFTVTLPVGRKHLKDEEIIEENVILSPAKSGINSAKNLLEINEIDPSHFDKLSVTENDDDVNEDRNILLVVEDNYDVREFIKDSLGNEFQIEEASNGEQGVRKAEQIIPDLIISDVMMPKMDGNELTKTLKNDEKTSHIPIILLTAKSEQESRLEGLETGADDYLTKPFDAKELQIRIKNLISIRRKLQEKFSTGDYVPVKRSDEKKLSNLEEQFMCKVMEVIKNHLSEEEFSIEQFGKEVGMDRVQLHRKLKALSGKSPSNYLRSVRLVRARKMIEEQKGNISEIAYSVGFSSPQYFTRCFREEFGYPPSNLTG
jgi:signal transduction histidine kinase/DNA-binding response OmpR family regulator